MENWYFKRTELAEKYLKIFEVGISSNLAIIAPRRKGKTLFVLQDISELAWGEKFFPIYASLWQNINSPHEGIILALEEAVEALNKKTSLTRLFNTKIKKTSVGNELIGKMEIEFANEPQEATNSEVTRIDQLLTTIQKKAKNRTVLLLIDEVQHLATSSNFDPLTHALRTMLDKRLGKIKTIFTGSSRHFMNLLFNESQSPFYHFVETVPFPELDDQFLEFIANKLENKFDQTIWMEDLKKAFLAIDQSPYWMMKIISHMLTYESSLKKSLEYVLQLIETTEEFENTAQKMKPIDKIVFSALASGQSPFSKALLEKIQNKTSIKGIVSNVQRSLQRLMENHLISQIKKGEYHIEKPGLKRYITDEN